MFGNFSTKSTYSQLTEQDINLFYKNALDILENIGVVFESDTHLDKLRSLGADIEGTTVKFNSKLVEDCLAKIPRKIKLCGIDKNNTIEIDPENPRVYFGTGGAASQILDLETGKARNPDFKDLGNIIRLCDNLENIHFLVRPVEGFSELDDELIDVNKAYTCFKNSGKHINLGIWTASGAAKAIDMAEMICGGVEALQKTPILSFISTPIISPLKFNDSQFSIIETIVGRKVPIFIGTDPAAGSTAPATLAGTLLSSLAESLFCVVLCQLLSPGTPTLALPLTSTSDKKTMNYLEGGVESGMMMCGLVQIYNHLKLPIVSDAGCSDSKIPDIQAGYEKGINIFQTANAGASLIHHSAGMLESMNAVAFEQFVIDNDINGMALRASKGIEINEETLAKKEIIKGQQVGNFLCSMHTIKNFRNQEFFDPKVAERNSRNIWEGKGSFDARQRAVAIVKDILDNYHPDPLGEELHKKIKDNFESIV